MLQPARWSNLGMTRPCWTLPFRQRSGPSSESMTNMRDPILAPHCAAAGIEKTVRRFGTMPQNGCHRNASLWLLRDMTSMCRVFETSRKQVRFILALEVEQIDHARVNCWCCFLQYFIWPGQEWNKMDLSSFHCSWLALGAWLEGCFPSCFRHICHGVFSVSPIGAGLCSCQLAAFEVHLPQVGTKTASNQWHFRFEAHLFDHTDPLPGFQDHADAHELMQNWQRLHFTGPQSKASLPPKGLCRGYCNVNFGMVKFAALTVWPHWMRCQSFRTSLDRMAESHCNSTSSSQSPLTFKYIAPESMTGIVAAQKTLDIQLVTAGAKKVASPWTVIPPTQNGCYRLVSLWFWWYAKSAWWTFETSWKCFTFMCALGAGQIDADSTAGHAICDNSLGHHQNCLYNMRKLPYDDHLVLAILTCMQLYTCRSTGCFTFCFLIGAMRWLSCKSAAKEVYRFDLDQWSISSLAK